MYDFARITRMDLAAERFARFDGREQCRPRALSPSYLAGELALQTRAKYSGTKCDIHISLLLHYTFLYMSRPSDSRELGVYIPLISPLLLSNVLTY